MKSKLISEFTAIDLDSHEIAFKGPNGFWFKSGL